MHLVDTHCHLYLQEFAADIEQVLERAQAAGVQQCLLPAIDAKEHERLIGLETRYPALCRAMMGLHPCSVKENYEEELALVEHWLTQRKFVAIGEIGLDYYWDKQFSTQQQQAFRRQLQWSVDYGLPVVIHSRESMEDCIRLIREYPAGVLRGVFHCFSGTLEQAHQIMEWGFYLGIGGVVTYPKAGLDQVVKALPLEALVLETDAPFLAPVPFRGKRNESSYLDYIVSRIANVKECTVEEVAQITTANAQKLFGL